MADLTQKAYNIAGGVVEASDRLMSALEQFQALAAEASDSGIDFTAVGEPTDRFNELLAASGDMKHLDNAMVAAALNSGQALVTLMSSGGPLQHRKNFQRMRK